MIYLIIIMSLIFVAIGYIVTVENARYLLSGYNTMKEEDRKKMDIISYIPYFKKFHVFLGISFLVIGSFLTYFFGETAGGIFLSIYPILAYIYFIWNGNKYSKGLNNNTNKIGIFILAGTLMFFVGLFAIVFKGNEIVFDNEKIKFEGTYGEEIKRSEIRTVELVMELPKIKFKTNGFSLGAIRKGIFNTSEGETIKLILNTDAKPYVLFTKTNGRKIYFSAKGKSNVEIYSEINKRNLPDVE